MKNYKIALFHPWIKSRGGAERVVLELLKNFKNIDVYTWVYDEKKTFKEFKKYKINVIAPKFFKRISRTFLLRSLFLPISFFSKIPLEKYGLFLISTSGLAELIVFRNYKKEKTGVYCHTILRAACKENIKWNSKRYKNPFSKLIYLLAARIYKFLEKRAWKKINWAVFNSEISLKRAEEHSLLKDKKIKIIYPPIDLKKFSKLKIKDKKFLLCVSRFNPDKRQDKVILAWKEFVKEHPKYKLFLVGNIENKKFFEKIKKMARGEKSIKIKTNLNEGKLLELYETCSGGIFSGYREDFGIVPFEFLAAGKPLAIVEGGGYEGLIKNLPQVVFFKENNNEKEFVEDMKRAMERIIKKKSKKIKIKEVSKKNFIKKINALIR